MPAPGSTGGDDALLRGAARRAPAQPERERRGRGTVSRLAVTSPALVLALLAVVLVLAVAVVLRTGAQPVRPGEQEPQVRAPGRWLQAGSDDPPVVAPLVLVRLPTSRATTVLAYLNAVVALASLACAVTALLLDLSGR